MIRGHSGRPISALLASIGLLIATYVGVTVTRPPGAPWNAPLVLSAFNGVAFLTAIIVAWLAASAFADEGSPTLLMIGLGVLLFGLGNMVGPLLMARPSPNAGVTLHNLVALASAVLLFSAGPIRDPVAGSRRKRVWIAVVLFAVAIAAVAALTVVASQGRLPSFIDAAGRGTPFREYTLGLAAAFLFGAAVQTSILGHRARAGFMMYLGYGMGFLSVGLATVAMGAMNMPIGWAGRLAQDMGLIFVLMGFVVAARRTESGDSRGRTVALSFRELESALEAAQDTTAELIRYAPTGICEVDVLRLRFSSVNDAMCSMLGYSREELLTLPALDLVPEEDRPWVVGRIPTSPGHALEPFDVRATRKDGRIITVSLQVRLSFNTAGSLVSVFVIGHDVTARRDAEREMALAARRFELALDAGGMSAWDWDITNRRAVWNDAHYELLGYEAGEVQPSVEAFLARVHEDDRDAVETLVRTALREGGPFATELRLCPQPGVTLWVEMFGRVESAPDGSPVRSYGVLQNVAARKERELALEESRRALALAEVVGHTGTWRWDLERGRADFSEGGRVLYGLPPGQLSASLDEVLARMNPEDRKTVNAMASKAAEEESEFSVDFRLARPDGTEVMLNAKGRVTERDAEGRPTVFVGMTQDVTDRRRAQQVLKTSGQLERRARQTAEALLETSTAMATGVRLRDVLETVCGLALSITNHSRATIILAEDEGGGFRVDVSKGVDPIPVTAHFFESSMSEDARDVYRSKRPGVIDYDRLGGVVPAFRGAVHSHLAYLVPLNYRGQVLGQLMIDDPEARSHFSEYDQELLAGLGTQAAVALANARLLEHDRESVALSNVLAGLRAELLSSAEPDEVLVEVLGQTLPLLEGAGAGIVELAGDDLTVRCANDPAGVLDTPEAKQLLEGLAHSCADVEPAETCAGSTVVDGGADLRMVVALVDDGTGRIGVAFAREARAFSAMERQFAFDFAEGLALAMRERRVRSEREWLASSRQEWLSGISHDLRTPLSSIRGYAQLLADDFDTPPEEVRREAGIMVEQAARLQSLVADMLLTFQIKEGALPMTMGQVDLVELLDGVQYSLTTDPRARGKRIVAESDGLVHTVNADFRLLERAIQNVVVNALSHNPEGTCVSLRATRVDDTEEILIADDGRGMNEEQLSRIWVRYERATGVGSDTDGVGLGVSISRQLVESMGGTIAISSVEGEGTTVTMRFAATVRSADGAGDVVAIRKAGPFVGRDVDDDELPVKEAQ